MFLKIFQNSLENTCAETFLLIKLQASAHNVIKKETPAQIFFVNFAKFFNTPVSIEHLQVFLED